MSKPEPCNHGRNFCMECHGHKGDFKTLPEMYDALAADHARLEQECKDAKCQAELMQRAAEVFREERDAALKQVDGFRSALEKIAAIEDRYNCGDWDEIEDAREIANAALSAKP